MKRALVVVGYGIAGLAVAVGLTVGAFAIAGAEISQPASQVNITLTTASPSLSPTPSAVHHEGKSHDAGSDNVGGSPSPSIDDNGGSGSGSGTSPISSGSESSSSDSGSSDSGSEDHSGSGSGDEHGGDD